MIRASKRQNPQTTPHLTVHQHIAWQKRVNYKLTAASLLTTLVSFILWLSGISLFAHLVGILLSFILGLFYPVKGSLAWAQTHIAKNIGQSYQTSLEYSGQMPYGLDTALFDYTKRALNKLEPPAFKRWWLPLMVISLGLTLLPYTPFRSLPRTVGFPGLEGTPFSNQPAQEQIISENQPESPQANQEQASNQLESQETGRPQTLDDAPGSNGQSLNDLAENVADEDALSRFLDNMREKEIANQPEPQEQQPPNTPQPNSSQGNPNKEGEGEGSQANQNTQQEGQQEEGQGDQTQTGQEESSSETTEGQNPEGNDSSSQSSDPDESQSQDQGVASSGEQPDSQGPSQNSPNEAAEEGADGSGINSSASRETQGLNSEEAQAEPEFLQGQISQGESNLAGTVRLPGSTAQTPGNFGPTAEGFQRAEEQAVTEGRIPIEYQEIIKNYFR